MIVHIKLRIVTVMHLELSAGHLIRPPDSELPVPIVEHFTF